MCSDSKTMVIRIMTGQDFETLAESYIKLEDFTISVSIHIVMNGRGRGTFVL